MEAFYFGSSENYLFGVHHPPIAGKDRGEGVLICGPFGQEYMRSHRSLRHLAICLSKLGYHVLRFDYRGQGDSSSDTEGVTPQQWQKDILCASQELLDVAMVKKFSIIGLRLGALLAGSLEEVPKSLVRLVLWDPVATGQDYLDEIEPKAKTVKNGSALSINGFIMADTFQDGLKKLSLFDGATQIDYSIDQVVSHETDAFMNLKNLWSGNEHYNFTLCPSPHDWNYVDSDGGILWPISILQTIVALFDRD